MELLNDKISVVLLGDWNKLYMQPDWISANIYELAEIDIGIEGQGIDFSISYLKNNVAIKPTQTKVSFTALDTSEETISLMLKCVNNFMFKAVTPVLFAYGLNADYCEDGDITLARMLDNMPVKQNLVDMGYEVFSTNVKYALKKESYVLNIGLDILGAKTIVHFNKHHENPGNLNISIDMIQDFLSLSREILERFGYSLEEECD